MTKIMLVEDDNNLREIYGARLMAEGFEIVSAADGEEALALAVKQKPDLIISDVMMPKISGFDMLDILRTTPETKNTKVIMMTALSQPEDRKRGEALGADKYLVKSQVTLEDVVTSVHDVLGDGVPAGGSATGDEGDSMVPPVVDTPEAEAEAEAPAAPDPAPSESSAENETEEPAAEEPTEPTPEEPPAATPAPEESETSTPEPPVDEPVATEDPAALADEPSLSEPAPQPTEDSQPEPPQADPPVDEPPETEGDPSEDPTQAPDTEEEPEPTAEDEAPSRKQKIIKPINDLNAEPSILQLAKEEELREQQTTPGAVISSPPEAPPKPAATPEPVEEAAPKAPSIDPPKVNTGMSESIADEKKELEEQIKEFVETSELVNGEPPKQVEPEKEPEVGDPEYQPPVAESDVVQVGDTIYKSLLARFYQRLRTRCSAACGYDGMDIWRWCN